MKQFSEQSSFERAYLETCIKNFEVPFGLRSEEGKFIIECPNYPELNVEAIGSDAALTEFKEGLRRKAKNYSHVEIEYFFGQLFSKKP